MPNSSSTSFPRLTALGHLQEYANSTDDAHTNLKSCLWQLTKSRRNVRGVMMRGTSDFKAESLREDWRARHRLINVVEDETRELVDEDVDDEKKKDKKTTAPQSKPPHWELQDVLAEKENTSNTSSPSTGNAEDPTATTGLRQRKTTTDQTSNKDQHSDTDDATWTIVQEEDLEDEEMMLLRKDPIELFGGSLAASRDLRIAQQHAKQAIEGYIQAANQAAKLLAIINEQQEKQEKGK